MESDVLVLEGVVTTVEGHGGVHVAPMGPVVDRHLRSMRLRPYRTSTTFANLERKRAGVLHVTDDVELIARAAIGQLDPPPPMRTAAAVDGYILLDACRWYAFRVVSIDGSGPRAEIEAEVVDRGAQREFFGFNRAKHAVLEAAILATRLEWLAAETVAAELRRLGVMVEKTAGDQERRAFAVLEQYIAQARRR